MVPSVNMRCVKKRLAVVGLMLTLAGCQQATTFAPSVSKEELAAERRVQQGLSQQKELEAEANKRERLLDMQERLHRVASKVEPAATTLCQEIHQGAQAQCVFKVVLADEPGVNAYADGERVVFLPGIMRMAKKDEELAYVMAHELSHNIMRHPQSTTSNAMVGTVIGALADALASSQGLNTGGGLSKLGGKTAVLAYSKDFEREADYIGMYILARSGYDVSKAPDFWRKMAAKNPDGIYVGTTHPTTPERYVAMNKTIAEIKAKQDAGVPLLPQRKQKSAPAASLGGGWQ